jgi:prepilin-type N-terminal cleavage/methylation domain-containing protein
MRYSARSTERRRRQAGFTLVEVIIASSIFVVVMIVALQQVRESGDVARLSTVQADLRRTGERVMQAIIKDLRSTQVPYVTTNATTTASAIQFAKINNFDTVNDLPNLEGNTPCPQAAGTLTANVIGTTTVLYTYQQGAGNCGSFGGDKNMGYLQFQKGTKTAYQAGAPGLSTTLSQELALANDPDWALTPYATSVGPLTNGGFQITRVGTITALASGLITTSNSTFTAFGTYNGANAPVTLRVKLILKRASGMSSTLGRQYAWTTVDTMVELKTDGSY